MITWDFNDNDRELVKACHKRGTLEAAAKEISEATMFNICSFSYLGTDRITKDEYIDEYFLDDVYIALKILTKHAGLEEVKDADMV